MEKGGTRPRPGAPGRVPPCPLRPAGRHPCPPCAAAVPPPARPRLRRAREMWRLVAAPSRLSAAVAPQRRRGSGLRAYGACQPPAVAQGTPPAKQGQGKPPTAGLALLLPRARVRRWCSGAARPPQCGGCGAVRAFGPCGGASASLASPATPAAQAVPRGSACALAARRSGLRGSRWATSGPRLAAAQALAPLRAASSLPACAGRSASRPCGGRN